MDLEGCCEGDLENAGATDDLDPGLDVDSTDVNVFDGFWLSSSRTFECFSLSLILINPSLTSLLSEYPIGPAVYSTIIREPNGSTY